MLHCPSLGPLYMYLLEVAKSIREAAEEDWRCGSKGGMRRCSSSSTLLRGRCSIFFNHYFPEEAAGGTGDNSCQHPSLPQPCVRPLDEAAPHPGQTSRSPNLRQSPCFIHGLWIRVSSSWPGKTWAQKGPVQVTELVNGRAKSKPGVQRPGLFPHSPYSYSVWKLPW